MSPIWLSVNVFVRLFAHNRIFTLKYLNYYKQAISGILHGFFKFQGVYGAIFACFEGVSGFQKNVSSMLQECFMDA